MDARPASTRFLLGTAILLAWGLLPASGGLARLNASLRDVGPNARDYDRIERGYYERLIDNDRRPERPSRESHAPFDAGMLAQSVDDVREYVLKPGLVATHKGATWTTNAHGMRDREYPDPKPPGTFRVALVGDSIAAGWGVDDGLGFEPVLERMWGERARGRSDGATPPRVEVLNFAVPGHAPGQRWEHFSRVGWMMSPDLVLFEGTPADLGWDERRLRALIPRGLGLDAPSYRDALVEVGITPGLKPDELKSRLRPHREAILLGVYRCIVADCHKRGIAVAWLLLPRVGKPASQGDRADLVRLAKAAGFDRFVDLSDAFDGRPASSLAIAADDFHPNAAGHAELARRIDAALAEFLSSSAQSNRPLQ